VLEDLWTGREPSALISATTRTRAACRKMRGPCCFQREGRPA
jgi:hypothetical protein